jgi:hypothetical protein
MNKEQKSQLNISVLGLAEITSDFGIESFLVSSPDKDVFQVNFRFLIFGNSLHSFRTIGGNDMRIYFLLSFRKYLFFSTILLFVLLFAVILELLLYFLLHLLYFYGGLFYLGHFFKWI